MLQMVWHHSDPEQPISQSNATASGIYIPVLHQNMQAIKTS